MAQPDTIRILWEDNAPTTRYPALAGDLDTDVCVIGAGITGLTTAWYLAQAGYEVVVLDVRRVGGGTTGSSTGNLYVPVGQRLASIDAKHGKDKLCAVVAARSAAIEGPSPGAPDPASRLRFGICFNVA